MTAVGGQVAAAPAGTDLVVAANRHSVCTRTARWLIHDLRNPIQALTLLTEIMGDGPTVGGVPIVESLRVETAHVARSLELLDRLVTRAPATEPGPVSLADCLRFVTALYRVHHTPVVLVLEGAGAATLPAVRGVAHEIELVVLNLVLNSLEALSGRPEGRIVLTTTHTAEEVRLAISDDGPGVLPGLEARMFEPGVSGWNQGGFAGLGLAASRGLARRHGGDLIHERGGGGGARFVLTLPVVR